MTLVTTLLSGISGASTEFKNSVVAASTANYTATYDNGASGLGATLTNNDTQAAFAIDGVNPSAGERVLIKDQSTQTQNGIYTVTTVGDGSTNWVLTRATDFDEPNEIESGVVVPVDTGGTSNGGTSWMCTSDVSTIGSDNITWIQYTVNPTDVCTLSTDQTITGLKTITNDLKIGADSKAVYFGAGDDATIQYDGTDLLVNSQEVGSGNLKMTAGNIDLNGNNLTNIAQLDFDTDWRLDAETVGGASTLLLRAQTGNTNAELVLAPIGTATQSKLLIIDDPNLSNYEGLELISTATQEIINSTEAGTGTALPLVLQMNGTDVLTIQTDFDMSANSVNLKNLADPVDAQDAVTLNYFDNNPPGAGGSNTQLQYNNSGVLAGISSLTYDGTNITSTRGVTVDGSSDEIQLKLQGHSTQTTNIFEIENSAASNLFTFDNSGVATVTGQFNIDNIRIDGNSITSTDAAGNIDLSPDTTGLVTINSSSAGIDDILDEDNMVSDSATALATQQSIKAYADTKVTAISSTDNAVARYDGTSGALQDSGVFIDDSDNLTSVNAITFSGDIDQTSDETAKFGNNASTTIGSSIVQMSHTGSADLGQLLIRATQNQFISFVDHASANQGWCGFTGAAGRTFEIGTGGTKTGGTIGLTVSNTQAVDVPNGTFTVQGTTAVSSILDEDDMSSDSATALATQQSIKAYVDNNVTGVAGATGSGYVWNEETGTSATMAVNNGYIANNAAQVTLTLPSSAAVGDALIVQGKGAGGWKIGQNAGQTIHFGGSDTTTGTGGSLESTQQYDSIQLVCITANTDFAVATAPQGTITVN